MNLVGQIAPDFTLPRDGGGDVTLSSFYPKKVVLYFYPKDDTSGCTLQAQDFTRRRDAFDAAGTVVIGVSKDSVARHDRFAAKYDLDVILVSDEGGDLCRRFGCWVEKRLYGRTYMGIERATFLIGGDGRVIREWRKVKVPGHVDEVLAATGL